LIGYHKGKGDITPCNMILITKVG